jgi:membrane protein implicated in regulation of membrane protease activity
MATPRIMVVLLAAAGVVVAAVVTLTLESRWLLGGVLVFHFVATVTVVAYALRRASETHDKPDPVTDAQIDEDRSIKRRQARRSRGRRSAYGARRQRGSDRA